MSERIEVLPIHSAQKPNATQPAGLCAGSELVQQNALERPAGVVMKPYLIGAVIAVLVAFLVAQQVQISHLSKELQQVSDNVKSSDVRTRLESQEESLDELNSRLAYLDSKINATEQKAQTALSRIRAHEEADVIGNMIRSIKQGLGIR
jgi:hypothetical protein